MISGSKLSNLRQNDFSVPDPVFDHQSGNPPFYDGLLNTTLPKGPNPAPTTQPAYTGPYITAVPDPTFWQRMGAYAKEYANAYVNNSEVGLYNGFVSIINNITYDWQTNYQHPVFEDRSSVYQLPYVNPPFHIDLTVDPNAEQHMRVMNKTMGVFTALAGAFIGLPEVGIAEESTAIGVSAGRATAAPVPSVFDPQIGASIEKIASEDAPLTFYRGDQAGLKEFRSYAAQVGGQAHSEAVLANGDPNLLMEQHAIDSKVPPSPYIFVTQNPNVARIYAGSKGSVYELQLAPGRALFNPFNRAVINGLPEEEYLVPHYISPKEIKGTLP